MKLDGISNQVYIVAINEAKLQSHEYVTPEHFLYSALMFDLGRDIIENSGGYSGIIISELQSFFDTHLQKIESGLPSESFSFVKLFEIAATQAVSSEKPEVTLGDLLAALMILPESFAAHILKKNGVDRLELLRYISFDLKERQEMKGIKKNNDASQQANGDNKQDVDYLKTYAVNLTELASKGELDPVVGREDIIERTILTLCRRIKNNPVHVGDAGVGKTAIVEGLAQKIVSGSVPEKLKNSQIFEVDMSRVLAGTKYRGDFEERLIQILKAAESKKDAIVYLDEIHNIAGAGVASSGGIDAASILKPYLVRGGLKFIGATTYEEYKKHFEKDSALTRRFQKIPVDEPSIADSIAILEGIKNKYEAYHNVSYDTSVIKTCCELANKYINDRKLPDKAIDIIDETGAYLRINAESYDKDDKDDKDDKYDNDDKIKVKISDIERTIAQIAKVPANSVSANETTALKTMEQTLKERIFGQDNAIISIVNAIKTARSGLNDSEKPVVSLLFVGPTGVGKTELVRQLAQIMNVKLLRFDMSEYQEQHSVARLIGSPPGYVGYENGGLLTDEVRKTPHCVLLLDEIEKAHADVFNVLLQVMDYGILTDNSGKRADFRNVILIMTSNAGAREIGRRIIGFDESSITSSVMNKEVERIFSPEFRNRLDDIIQFNHINEEIAINITKKALSELERKIKDKDIKLVASDDCIHQIAKTGLSKTYGAREIIRLINKEVKKQLAEILLFDEEKHSVIKIEYIDGKIQLEF